MNNSFLAIENVRLEVEEKVDNTESMNEKEAGLVSIIEAIRTINASKEWSTLKEKVFDDLVSLLNSQMTTEARKEIPDTLKLNRLAGQLKWAEKYADLTKLENVFLLELTNIRKLLHGKEE
jgi:hypothetical protein